MNLKQKEVAEQRVLNLPGGITLSPSNDPLPEMRDVFMRYGLDPDRVLEFLHNNIALSREVSELNQIGGDTADKIKYLREQMTCNEAEILATLLKS